MTVLADAISGVGSRMQFSGYFGSDADRGVGLVASMGGAVAQGAAALLDGGNAYAAAALLRQVVEVEYLLWTFADDSDDASRWFHASKNQLSSRFRPAAMRTRSKGRFRAEEYASHCDRGGHPSPRGWDLVVENAYTPRRVRLDSTEALRLDLAVHLNRAWHLLTEACDAIERSSVYSTYVDGVIEAVTAWRRDDAAALDLAPPTG